VKEPNKKTNLGSMPLLDTLVIERTEDFAVLEEEWEDLYRNSPLATPFQSWAWLYSWWEAYGEDYELRLVVIREAGLLVGLMPFMLERRRGFGRLLFVGTGLTDHLDILARRGWEPQVVEVGSWVLQQMDAWHVADLQELRPTAVAWSIFRGWTGPRARAQQSECVEIKTKPWEELLKSLSKNGREKARKTLRRAEEDEVSCKPADHNGVERATRSWLALHREYWQDRGINPEHLTWRFSSHVLAAAKRMSASGSGRIYEFRRGEEVITSDFVLVGHEYVASYLHGANKYARGRFQLNALLMWNWANVAVECNLPTVSMLRGADEHKLRWNPKIIVNHRLILGKHRISFAPYATYHLLRSKVVEYTESEYAPSWIKPATDRLKKFLLT
jgi:CelD/BcsL family acetyltransferase involved in cellulose biosynthesis